MSDPTVPPSAQPSSPQTSTHPVPVPTQQPDPVPAPAVQPDPVLAPAVQPDPVPAPAVQPDPTPPSNPIPTPAPQLDPAQVNAQPASQQSSKTIILCFDGTGNKFGTHNSNVVRFMHTLEKKKPDKQIIYYQPGIGTYLQRKFLTKTFSYIWSKFDVAFAWNLSDHVKDGYKFLMQHYRPGDSICLFGFSRGAYTARALSGMIYKVGLLPADNDQQLDFAFEVYNTTTRDGADVARQFKEIFSIPVKVHFLGVWDTVSSVGLVPRSLPYSTQNDGVKYFRHALALDERRARFRPNLWGEPIAFREELDTIPELPDKSRVSDDFWVYRAPSVTDVKEVWFPGAHADVGGGSHEASYPSSLSLIPLRWMIKECFITGTKIEFNEEKLQEEADMSLKLLQARPQAAKTFGIAPPLWKYKSLGAVEVASEFVDMLQHIYDQLTYVIPWWILEYLPLLSTWQKTDGTWAHWRRRNWGNGRFIPEAESEVLIHRSVDARIKSGRGYSPRAINWGRVMERCNIRWVD